MKTCRAFTLIELLVVLSVVALLLSVALPRYMLSLEKSRDTVLHQNLKVVRISLDKFRADKGRWPATLEELVSSRYLGSTPVDPITESSTTWQFTSPMDRGESGISDIRSGAPEADRDGRPYSSY